VTIVLLFLFGLSFADNIRDMKMCLSVGIKRHCYELFSEKVTWDVARTNCLTKNGILTSVHDIHESHLISEMAGTLPVWIGGRRENTKSPYFWADDQENKIFDHAPWNPINSGSDVTVCVVTGWVSSKPWLFDDQDCSNTVGYVCKY
jgi:Lectin C-type domain